MLLAETVPPLKTNCPPVCVNPELNVNVPAGTATAPLLVKFTAVLLTKTASPRRLAGERAGVVERIGAAGAVTVQGRAAAGDKISVVDEGATIHLKRPTVHVATPSFLQHPIELMRRGIQG